MLRSGPPDLGSLAPSIAAADARRCRILLGLLGEALRVLDPERAVARVLSQNPIEADDVTVVALGKASAAMARGAALALGGRMRRGLVVSDHAETVPEGVSLRVTAHPLPDESSIEAGRQLLRTVAEATGHVVFLVSGGGSALAEVPVPGVSLEDLIRVYDLLLRRGVPIEDANVIRASVSALKGGKLAAAASVPISTVVLSDVGPRLELVASGPSLPCPASPDDALAVLRRHRLLDEIPPTVISALRSPTPPLPHPGGTVLSAGDGTKAARIVTQAGRNLGIPISVLTTDLKGEAAGAAERAVTAAAKAKVGVLAGETTVTVRGAGRGGRNQEAALAASLRIDGTEDVFVALGTDGVDGPTDAAGAYVDGTTADRIRAAGIDPRVALADNDSHSALQAAGALIRTGPTGINVADLWVVDRR